MQIFPAQYSTLSSIALLEFVNDAYSFELRSCKFLLRGVSDTYIIEGKREKFILKIYRSNHRSYTEIAGEIELLNYLKAKGVSVAFPVADKTGHYIQQFFAPEGIRYGVIFIFAKGKNIFLPEENDLISIGAAMAGMHLVTEGLELVNERIIYNIESTLNRPLEILKPAFDEFPEGYAYLKRVAERVIVKMDEFDASAFCYGYCHFDFLPKNFHFDDEGRITFFDFDWAGRGYLVNDLATFFFQYFWLVYYKRITAERAKKDFDTFVAAYRNIKPISEEELAAIPYLGLMFQIFGLGFQYENYDDFSNTYFNVRYLHDRVNMIKDWIKWYCELPESV